MTNDKSKMFTNIVSWSECFLRYKGTIIVFVNASIIIVALTSPCAAHDCIVNIVKLQSRNLTMNLYC